MQPAPFALERYFAAHEFSVQHLLSSSDCEPLTISELLAMDGQNELEPFGSTLLGYTDSIGSAPLRREIARIYTQLGPDDVLVHAGAQEAIFAFMSTVLSPGDHIIVHEPAYQSLFSVAEARGIGVTRWRAREDEGWRLDLDALAAQITPSTRAIVINCPHNPTGYIMSKQTQAATVALARKHGLWIFSDEVYRELEHDPADRIPAICDVYERGISLGVMSKTYGLAGLRIGWVATRDSAVRETMAAFKDYLTICNSPVTEALATIALRHRDALAAKNRRIVADNLAHVEPFFARREDIFDWRPPAAGPVAFVKLRRGGAAAFCEAMIREAGVLLLPSHVFDWGDGHVRFGFGRKRFQAALAALDGAL